MKKHMIRMALAGALAFGVASVSKAADEATSPVWSGLAQETLVQHFATVAGTGTNLNAGLENVRLQGVFKAGSDDTVTVGTSFAAQYVNGFLLLDAYDSHSLNNLNSGLSLKIGQFKEAFGADAYSSPDQLIRANYSVIDAIVPNNVANEGNAWKVGAELDQTYSDLTIQVAAVQNVAYVASNGTKFDYVGRAEWKGSNIALGVSDYLQSTNPNLTLNTLGANGSLSVDVAKLDLEAIFGGAGVNGYTGTLSAKFSDLTPAVWYEWETTSAGANINTLGTTDLGAGLNWQLNSNNRIALNVDFTGPNNGDILSINTETVQFQQTF
jgi:hypothetical protein